jgi:cation transporter-like permease
MRDDLALVPVLLQLRGNILSAFTAFLRSDPDAVQQVCGSL